MRRVLYVVTEAVEACGKSMEILSPEERQGGVFEDAALALHSILNETNTQHIQDRFLYSANFEGGELRLNELIFGLCFDQEMNHYRIVSETMKERSSHESAQYDRRA